MRTLDFFYKRKESIIVWTTFILFIYMPLASINAHVVQNINSSLYIIVKVFLYIISSLMAVFSGVLILKKITVDSIILIVLLTFLYLIMLIRYPQTVDMYTNLIVNTFFAFYWFLLVRNIENYDYFIVVFHKVALIVFIATLVYVLLSGFSQIDNSYSLAYGYIISIAPISFFNKLFNKFNVVTILKLASSIVLTLAMGARGPLLVITVYVLLKILKETSKMRIRGISYFIAIQLFLVTILINVENIVTYLSSILSKMGVSTRIISQLTGQRDQGITESFGRQAIWEAAIDSIKESPLLGVGIGFDRILLSNVTWGNHTNSGYKYPHNFFLEISMQFGIIVSILVSLFLIILTVKLIFSKDLEKYSEMGLIFFSIGFVPLFLSHSYLTKPEFFAFLAICLTAVCKNKKIKKITLKGGY